MRVNYYTINDWWGLGDAMSRQTELAKNTIILTIGKICTQFVSFLLLPLYTALLSPEENGIVDVINTYVMLLVPVFNWQFENGLFRFLIDYRTDKKKQVELFSTVFMTNFFQSLLYIIFYLIFFKYLHSEFKIFLAVDVVLNIFLNTFLQFARGLGKNVNYSCASFLSASLAVFFNVCFVAGLRMGAYGIFGATLLSKIITIIYLIISIRVLEYVSIKKFDICIFKSVSRYSIPLIPNQLSWWVVGTSDRIIISHFLGVVANGIYFVANKFSSVYVTFYNVFYLSWSESVSVHLIDEDRDIFLTDTINTIFNLFATINIGIIACMPFIFRVMVNQQYAEAYFQIPILMIAVLFQVVVGLYSGVYVALKKSVEIAKTSTYAAVINFVLNILLIEVLGLYAASISTLVAYALMAVYRGWDIKKYVNITIYRKNIIITAIMMIVTLMAYYYNNKMFNVVVLLIVIIYSYWVNKKFLKSLLRMVLEKARSIWARKG